MRITSNEDLDRMILEYIDYQLQIDYKLVLLEEATAENDDTDYWDRISLNNSIPVSFFERHITKLDWEGISCNEGIPLWFFEKHIDMVDWYGISMNASIPIAF